MKLQEVYIIQTSNFLPNKKITNDEMEVYLGLINKNISRTKAIVLRSNGIKGRYYAMDKKQKPTHSNAEMAAISIKKLFKNTKISLENIDLLSCGTSSPDQFLPSHTSMVHGFLPRTKALEIHSPSGACCSGMQAFKYAFLSLMTGNCSYAISSGSERASRLICSEQFEAEAKNIKALEENGYLAFEKDFLRWMLSDGAGSFLMTTNKKLTKNTVSLKVEWIEGYSFAHQVETCMYHGCDKKENGEIISYKDLSQKEIINNSIFSIKQDTKILSKNIISLGFKKLPLLLKEKGLKGEDIDYFLPHISSYFFYDKIADSLKENGINIAQEKWFTNLKEVGNIGSASIYIMVDTLFKSKKLKKGERILLAVPESARFSYMFALLTVV